MEKCRNFVWIILVITLGLSSTGCIVKNPVHESGLNRLQFSDSDNTDLILYRNQDFYFQDTIPHGIYIEFADDFMRDQILKLRNPQIVLHTDSGSMQAEPMNILSSILPKSPFYFNVNNEGQVILWTSEGLLFLERTRRTND